MTETTESPDQKSAEMAEVVKRGPGRPKKKQAPTAPVAEPILVTSPDNDKSVPSAVVTPKTKFYKGMWSAKAAETDPESVRLAVNGETLVWQRSVEVIVPYPYLVVAQNAKFPKFKQEPGKGRKVATWIERFPFTILGEATYEEFRKAFLDGTKKTREKILQHGLNIPIEESVPQLT